MAAQTDKPGMSNVQDTLEFLVLVLRKHWPILLGALLLASGASLIYSKAQVRIYQAEAMVDIEPAPASPLGERDSFAAAMGMNYFDSREYLETQYRIITSTPVMTAAARDLRLQNDLEFFGLAAPPRNPITLEGAARELQRRVTVEPVRNSRLASVRVEDPSPERARRICQAIVEAYRDQNLQRAINASSEAFVWLGDQVDSLKKELEQNENALHEFKSRNELPSISINETSNMIRQEMLDFSTDLSHTRAKKKELEARHAELSKILDNDPEKLPASELLNNQFLQKLRQDYLEAKRVRKTLMAEGRGENHPAVRSVDEKFSEARTALLGEVRNIQGAVERDLAIITREETGKAGLYDAAHRRAVDLNMKEIEYHRLDRTRDQNEKLYALLLEHMKQTDLSRMMRVNNVRIVEGATSLEFPIRPRTSTNLGVGLFLGFLIGFALMWLREIIDNRLKTPEDVEREVGVTFLGLLPSTEDGGIVATKRSRLRRRTAPTIDHPEFIAHEKPRSGLAEAARSIRTNLIFTNPDRPYRRLLVTSAAPSEGKTTVACSIAIALAQSGQRVCIVDCDLRRPRLHRLFDRVGTGGLTSVLLGENTVEEVALPSKIENLWCMPAGPTPPNPADVLHSERFRRILQELSERFDRVVIDSPPLVAVTDSAIISTLVDGTIFVLRAFQTTRALARQGIRALTDVDANIAGAVLNAVDFSREEYHYYQYYYYKRTGYGGPNDEGVKATENWKDAPKNDESPAPRHEN